MTNKNEIKTFGLDGAAVVFTADEWAALAKRVTGYENGIVDQKSFNTPHRQAAFVANMIAQFTCDYAAVDVLDNGDSATFEANFVDALTKAIGAAFSVGLLHYCVDGDADANVLNISGATPTPDFTVLQAGTTLLIKVLTTNTGAVSVVMPHSLGTISLINPDGTPMSAGQLHTGGLALCSYDGSALQLLASMNASGTVEITNAASGEGISVQTVSPYAVSINFPGLAHNGTIHDADIFAYYNGPDGHHRGITWGEVKAAIISAVTFPAADNPLSRDGTTGHYKIARATVAKAGVGVGHAATSAEITAMQTDPTGDGPAFLRADDIPSLRTDPWGTGIGAIAIVPCYANTSPPVGAFFANLVGQVVTGPALVAGLNFSSTVYTPPNSTTSLALIGNTNGDSIPPAWYDPRTFLGSWKIVSIIMTAAGGSCFVFRRVS